MNEILLAHMHIETPIVLSSDYIFDLIIENPKEFYSMVNDLILGFSGEESRFVFSEAGKVFSPNAKGELIHNIFDFAIENKKALTSLYKFIEERYNERGSSVSQSNLMVSLSNLFSELFSEISVPIDYDEPTVTSLLKACAVRPRNEFDSLSEKLICLINLAISLKNIKFFVFVDVKSILDDEAVTSLFEHCRREKVAIMFVESVLRRPLHPFEKGVHITDDLCEILA